MVTTLEISIEILINSISTINYLFMWKILNLYFVYFQTLSAETRIRKWGGSGDEPTRILKVLKPINLNTKKKFKEYDF